MDEPRGLTADQIAKLASMVSSWAPRHGKVDEMIFREDEPDVILDVRVLSRSGAKIPVKVRIRHEWLDKIARDELEPHAHRILNIVEENNLGNAVGDEYAKPTRGA